MNSDLTSPADAHRLSREQIRQFHDLGYAGPFSICPEQEMERIRRRVADEVLGGNPKSGPRGVQSRHLDSRIIWDLCSHPAIVGRMQSAFGPDLILWRSHLFDKPPGAAEVPWHQDLNYWPIEPAVNISAWLALTEAVVENSCVQVIPGSHKRVIPHVASVPGMAFRERADPEKFDASKAVPMQLKPGEFFLFTERLLHYSAPNTSSRPRLGLAIRVTVPFVKVDHAKLFKGHKCIQLSGRDLMGFNDMADPPAAK